MSIKNILQKEQLSLLLLLCGFSVYLFVHNQQLYNFPGTLDGYTSIAIEQNYAYSDWQSYYYKNGRAPFYIVNRWIRGIFHPVVATTIFSYGYVLLSALAFFIFLYRKFNSNTAFITSLLFLFLPFILLQSGGVDYYSLFAGLCFLWSLVFFQNAQIEKNPKKQAWFYTLTGIFYALSFWSHIFYFVFFPIYLFLHWEKFSSFREFFTKKGLVSHKNPFLFMIFGILGITVCFGLINFVIYGRNFFFQLYLLTKIPQQFTRNYSANPFAAVTVNSIQNTVNSIQNIFTALIPQIEYRYFQWNFQLFYYLNLILVFLWIWNRVTKRKNWDNITLPIFYLYLILIYFILQSVNLLPVFMSHPVHYSILLFVGTFIYPLLHTKKFSLIQKFTFTGIVSLVSTLSYFLLQNIYLEPINSYYKKYSYSLFFTILGLFLLSLLIVQYAPFLRTFRKFFLQKQLIVLMIVVTCFVFILHKNLSYNSLWIELIFIAWFVLIAEKTERKHWIKVAVFVLLFSCGIVFLLKDSINISKNIYTAKKPNKDFYLSYLELSQYLQNSILTETERNNSKGSFFPFGIWYNQNLSLLFFQSTRIISTLSGFQYSFYNQAQNRFMNLSEIQEKDLLETYKKVNGIVLINDYSNDAHKLIDLYKKMGLQVYIQAEFPYRRGEINWGITVLRFKKDTPSKK